MRMVTVPVIKNDDDLEFAIKRIEELWGAELDTPEGDELEVLVVLVEAYEQEHYPIDPPDPVETVLAAMEERGATRGELAKILGGASRVSEFLNRKRNLTKSMIRRLHEEWSIPLEVLVQESREG